MRRSYISPEYYNNNVYGTLNMVEESNFFNAKMLEIEDSIKIENQDIIYYQKLNNEQIDISVETSLDYYIYSSPVNKMENHTISIDDTQTKYQLENNTRWKLKIDLKSILSDFLFATLKTNRTFEGVKNEMNRYNDVNVAIRNYIESNILNRYRFKSITLYIKYKDIRNQSTLKYATDWNPNIDNVFDKIQTEKSYDGSSIKILFNQDKSSSEYNFDYYFDILFEKI